MGYCYRALAVRPGRSGRPGQIHWVDGSDCWHQVRPCGLDLPGIAVRHLSRSDAVRAANLLPSSEPQVFSLERPNAKVLIAGGVLHDPERALKLIADLRGYDAVMARAMICASGGSARAPDLTTITPYETRIARTRLTAPPLLNLPIKLIWRPSRQPRIPQTVGVVSGPGSWMADKLRRARSRVRLSLFGRAIDLHGSAQQARSERWNSSTGPSQARF